MIFKRNFSPSLLDCYKKFIVCIQLFSLPDFNYERNQAETRNIRKCFKVTLQVMLAGTLCKREKVMPLNATLT